MVPFLHIKNISLGKLNKSGNIIKFTYEARMNNYSEKVLDKCHIHFLKLNCIGQLKFQKI